MAGFFDDIEDTTSPVVKSFFDDTEEINAPAPERTLGSTLKDTGISLAKGVIGAGQGIVGLADIPTGGRFGRGLEYIGIKPEEWQADLSEEYSLAQQEANKKVDTAKGFVDTAQAMLENPSTIAHGIVETLPSVAAGGVLGRGALALSSKLLPKAVTALGKTGSAIAAGAVGEGAISGGQTAEQIRNATPDDLLTAKQSALAVASGLGTSAFGIVGGSLAKKLGFADIDTMVVAGLNPAKKEGFKGVVKSIVGGGITEGVFEELPQTVQETIFTNAALDKPLLNGVPEGAAQAIILGATMGAGANLLPGANKPAEKTEQELELDRRAANILNLKEDELGKSVQKLTTDINSNQELINDLDKLEQKARELNVDPAELIRKTVDDNKNSQSLLDRINSGIQKKEELVKKEYESLSPEEKQVREIEDKLTTHRYESASQLNERITNIDNEITTLSEQYNRKFDPYALDAKTSPGAEERKVIEDKLITLNKRRNELLDKETPEVKKAFAPYTTRDGRQKYLEELFGTVNVGEKVGIEKDAVESFQNFEANNLLPIEMANYANGLIKLKSDQQTLDSEQQALKPLEENNLKQIEDYANYIRKIGDRFTPTEQAIIENYWQSIKKELTLRREEMTPGTEAFMRKKFFETQLANIEGNVKSDTAAQGESKQNVVPSLAEQNKRQQWFQQIAKDLGDVQAANSQAIETEIPRNLPGGLQSGFTNERQVGSVPQFQVGANQEALSKVNLEDIKKAFPNQTITQHENGSVSVHFKNGQGVKINSIQGAGQDFVKLAIETGQMSKTGKILGITIGNEILLDQNFAYNKTLWHENKHVLDNLGLITEVDDSALNKEFNKLRKAGKLEFALSTHKDPKQRMVENRANMFAQIMVNRAEYRNTAFGKVIQRVMDFFQQLLSFGKQTVSGLASEVESGKIYERQAAKRIKNQATFKEWFGNSKVVDVNGNPIVVYHGTNKVFSSFSEDKLGKATGAPSASLGFFFSSNPAVASSYASTHSAYENVPLLKWLNKITKGMYEKANEKVANALGVSAKDTNGNVIPTYLSLQNPLIVNLGGKEHRERSYFDIITEAKNKGHDGVIIKNTFDRGFNAINNESLNGLSDIYVVFKPTQIKSIFNNEWDSTDPNFESTANQWYSALENAVAGFQQKQATPDQWKGMIGRYVRNKNDELVWKGFPGIKPDEVEWLGLYDWLDKQKGKVSKEELAQFIAENNVRLEEVVKESQQTVINKLNTQLEPFGYKYEYDGYDEEYSMIDIQTEDLVEFEDLSEEVQSIVNKSAESFPWDNGVKHEGYQLPGGKNYKELLITAPKIPGEFINENHFSEPNILAHIRFNERTDADGNKVLFLEEIQSDWHQAGKKEGYKENLTPKRIEELEQKHHDLQIESLTMPEGEEFNKNYNERVRIQNILDGSNEIPDAPFKNSTQWSLLAMKRMVRYAAENGFDKIAWTTGQQQFDRYVQGTEEEKAKRLHGMQEFYDKILPNTFNAEFNKNKWGNAKVEITESNLLEDKRVSKEEALEAFDKGEVVFIGENPVEQRSDLVNYQQGAMYITVAKPVQNLSIPITNRMKSKALREGMPMFEVREAPSQKISDDVYHQMFSERNSLVRTIGQTLRMRGHEIKQLIDKGLGSISTRLKNVDPMLRAEIRNLDFRTAQKIVTALRIAHPLLEKTKQMSPQDKFVWDAARRNSDEVKIKEIAAKYNMTADQEKLRAVLDQIRQDAIDVGYDVGFIEEYWPRIIKDQEGFLQATKGISQRPVITDTIKVYADKLGMTVEKFEIEYPEQAADIASNTILGRNLGIGGPGNIQARQYETVPPELNKFYMDSDAALMQYIYSMTKKIEARRFFGKVPERIASLKAEKKRKQGMLTEYEKSNNAARVEDVSGDLIRIEQELDKYKLQRDYTENIGTYINDLRMSGRIQADDEKVVRDILDARFHEHGATGIVNAYKNISYIDVMGSPISALTQIGDLAWAMYVGKVWTPRGLADTIKNVGKAITKKSEITKEDLGIERIAQEFADGTTLGNAVSWVFKKVGLERIDSIGKETLINNAFSNYKVMASTEDGRQALLKQIKPIFGTQSQTVINDLLAGNPTDNVKMLLYHRLLDFQPVALSEMSEQYLKSGNGRVFYMLKTYTLKQFDVFRNEAWHKIKTGERDQVIEGIGNMIKLVSLLTLANAGADELKDWMLGKETKFEDNVIENFLTMGGASKFVRMQTTREGLGSGLIGQILPPFRFVNSISKDLNQLYGSYITGDTIDYDHARIVESIPIGGKLYYWHYGRGEDYKKSSNEQEFGKISKEVDTFKKQLENSEDKRTFLNSNLDGFKQMKLHENFQSALNRNQAVINKLKKIDQTTNVRERLGQLQQQREVILKRYFDVTNTVQ